MGEDPKQGETPQLFSRQLAKGSTSLVSLTICSALLRLARRTDNADYAAGETSENVPRKQRQHECSSKANLQLVVVLWWNRASNLFTQHFHSKCNRLLFSTNLSRISRFSLLRFFRYRHRLISTPNGCRIVNVRLQGQPYPSKLSLPCCQIAKLTTRATGTLLYSSRIDWTRIGPDHKHHLRKHTESSGHTYTPTHRAEDRRTDVHARKLLSGRGPDTERRQGAWGDGFGKRTFLSLEHNCFWSASTHDEHPNRHRHAAFADRISSLSHLLTGVAHNKDGGFGRERVRRKGMQSIKMVQDKRKDTFATLRRKVRRGMEVTCPL
ncbi:unnamed protein product [Protopolystoma xenopodis]|uniref:Uncharacterized protein n=1 Tax=Protopolystoma xenopodis TaxID=117903 RepID=A0A448XD70_9PLAT|nr:unnamed protein product [Protopolystoma xenopodis]